MGSRMLFKAYELDQELAAFFCHSTKALFPSSLCVCGTPGVSGLHASQGVMPRRNLLSWGIQSDKNHLTVSCGKLKMKIPGVATFPHPETNFKGWQFVPGTFM